MQDESSRNPALAPVAPERHDGKGTPKNEGLLAAAVRSNWYPFQSTTKSVKLGVMGSYLNDPEVGRGVPPVKLIV